VLRIVFPYLTIPSVTLSVCDSTLAELMLPDGAHLRQEDWTIFYLNQTKMNAVSHVLSSESPKSTSGKSHHDPPSLGIDESKRESGSNLKTTGAGETEELGELLFVLNCVRMKADKTVRR
jgi:hypothetical protein